MLKNRKIKRLISGYFTCLYLFLAIFSQQFHQHSFENFTSQNSQEYLIKAKKATTSGSSAFCLSCHFLLEGNAVLPKETLSLVSEKKFLFLDFFFKENSFAFYRFQGLFLRGPPLFID